MDPTYAALMESLKRLHADFTNAHEDGMAALKAGDLEAFGEAIRRERAVIDERRALLQTFSERSAEPNA